AALGPGAGFWLCVSTVTEGDDPSSPHAPSTAAQHSAMAAATRGRQGPLWARAGAAPEARARRPRTDGFCMGGLLGRNGTRRATIAPRGAAPDPGGARRDRPCIAEIAGWVFHETAGPAGARSGFRETRARHAAGPRTVGPGKTVE